MKVVRITGGPTTDKIRIVTDAGVDITSYVSAVHYKADARGIALATATLTVNAEIDLLANVEGL